MQGAQVITQRKAVFLECAWLFWTLSSTGQMILTPSVPSFSSGRHREIFIAHEVARRFDETQRLSSSFVFRRGDGPKPQDLFSTLVRNLSDRYPSFRAALGEVIKNNTSLRLGHNQDYHKLFQSLLRDQQFNEASHPSLVSGEYLITDFYLSFSIFNLSSLLG